MSLFRVSIAAYSSPLFYCTILALHNEHELCARNFQRWLPSVSSFSVITPVRLVACCKEARIPPNAARREQGQIGSIMCYIHY